MLMAIRKFKANRRRMYIASQRQYIRRHRPKNMHRARLSRSGRVRDPLEGWAREDGCLAGALGFQCRSPGTPGSGA